MTTVRVFASRPSAAAVERVRERLDDAGIEWDQVVRLDDGIEVTFPEELDPEAESTARGLTLEAVAGRGDDPLPGSLRERVALLEAEVERLAAIVDSLQSGALQDSATQEPATTEP